ncbi:MAG: WbuC family cupin fold metalloprotein, partial [Betaproteobacteria bacterium]
EAAASPRRRKNFNFHALESAPANRLLNAIEPDSYVRPHRHLDPAKDETLVVLRGAVGLVVFDDKGAVLQHAALRAGTGAIGVDIPHATWHTFVGLEPGSVIFEAKAGPYQPLARDEKAFWAPAEEDPTAGAYLEKLNNLFRSEQTD